MNRFKREQLIKDKAILDNCTPLEIKRFEYEQSVEASIFEYARTIHIERFPEEYDFTLDDHVDYAARRKGINPMSEEYINTVAHKRAEAGVVPLDDSGMPVSTDSFELCYREAEAVIRGE